MEYFHHVCITSDIRTCEVSPKFCIEREKCYLGMENLTTNTSEIQYLLYPSISAKDEINSIFSLTMQHRRS